MKKSFYLKSILIIGIYLLLSSCVPTNREQLPPLQIKAGTARLSGEAINFPKGKITTLVLSAPNPITGERSMAETMVAEDGSFSFDIPIETDITLGCLLIKNSHEGFYTTLSSSRETKIVLTCDETGNTKKKEIDGLNLFHDDINYMEKITGKMLQLGPKKNETATAEDVVRFIDNPKEYIPFALKYDFALRLKPAQDDTILTDVGRNYLINWFKPMFAESLFNYTDRIAELIAVTRSEGDTTTLFTPQEPNKSYYGFLKEFTLNDSQNLYYGEYSNLLQTILANNTLNIPSINDMAIDEWLKGTKNTLVDLVGFNDGLFYDVLIGNAYCKQFMDDLKPLSDKQKQNINNYFEGGEIEKILLRKNEEIIKRDKEKEDVIINETSTVANEKLLDDIISKYKGKVIIVDFWATWCPPCLSAMEELKSVKHALKDKNVVFVYITDVSSPRKMWESKIIEIGGEHYYLTQDQWEYVSGHIGFESIPTYLLYDKNGKLKNKITGYPGTEKMQEMIEELL